MKYFKITDIDSAERFNENIAGNKAIVKYYAPWCGYCKHLRPKWDNACNRNNINVDKDYYDDGNDDSFILAEASDKGIPHMKSYNDVQAFPTILYLEDGKKKDTYQGDHDEEELYSWMNTKIKSKSGGGKRKTRKVNKKSKRKTIKRTPIYCAHMPPSNGKHIKATKKHVLELNNKNYNFKTCCNGCAYSMKSLANSNPKKFIKEYVAKINKDHLLLKNKQSGKIVQKAPLKKNIHTKKNKKRTKKGGSFKTSFGIGPFKLSKETGSKSWKPNSSGDLEAHDNDCYNINGVGACKTKEEKSKKPWYSLW